MPSKKEKKYAKETGGISAAVTKQAAAKLSKTRSSENNALGDGAVAPSKSHTASETSSSSVNTPELKPSAPPTDNGNHLAASPLLDALSTTSASPDTAPSMTNEWAQSVMAGSPNNLINFSSESPPTQPSSYEDSVRLHHRWAASQRPRMSSSPVSLSPPGNSNRRPLSFQSDTQHHLLGGTPPKSSSAAYRRSSLYSQFGPPKPTSPRYPPLPHQSQPHFYGVQDLDLTITPLTGMRAGDRGLYFGFDQLSSEHALFPSTRAGHVILAGHEGGLQVCAVGKKGVDLLSGLKGLRGGVHHAKILPWTSDGPSSSLYPLVAVVVHGPVLPSQTTAVDKQHDTAYGRATRDSNLSPRSVAYDQPDGLPPARSGPPVQYYQTSVEVYSLRTQKRIDVLLEAPKIPINTEISLSSPLFQHPPPSGAFSIKADSGTIAICSGVTGECWIYRQLLEPQNHHTFACAGKIWTTVQQGHRPEVVEEATYQKNSSAAASGHGGGGNGGGTGGGGGGGGGNGGVLPPSPRASSQTPILALNGRWIAYCPPAPSSQTAFRAHLPVPTLARAPGVLSMAPPHLPATSCALDLPKDSVMNKIMRETTQELISGMKWVGQQGLQAWNSYWSQPHSAQSHHQQQQQQQQQPQQARSPPSPWMGGSRPFQPDGAQFPPTHGTSSTATAKDSGLISILDIEALPTSATIHPLATFSAPLGCSFLSFSPSSLALFSASTKGDVQFVWDLLRLQHTCSSPLQTTLPQHESLGPQIRSVAHFSRMTTARIVDVAWSEPHGDRLAMVTERGTVHLREMESASFMWPPPRRRKPVEKNGAEASESSHSAVSIASGAIGAAYQAAKPLVSRSRRGSVNIPSLSAGTSLRDSATQGGRALAASITHSLGKTGEAINNLRHTADNRVSLPSSANPPSMSCVSWFRSRRTQTLFTIGAGMVRVFSHRSRPSSTKPGKKVSRTNRYKDMKVPLLPDDLLAPLVRQIVDLGVADECWDLSEAEVEAGDTMTLETGHATTSPQRGLDATIPQAEIESSAPYQPFRTDRRVNLCEYGRVDSAPVLLANASLEDKSPTTTKKKKRRSRLDTGASLGLEMTSTSAAWAFGASMSCIKSDMGLPPSIEDDSTGVDDYLTLPQSAMERVMQYGDAEQIVVTTRRRRGARQGDMDEDGFFEDDCEVLDFADQRV